jgi:23S rRNA pseudouridine1911/1915/1917 synthase
MNRGWSYREQVGPDAAGLTVLAYLTATRLHSSAAEWAARLHRGEVEIEGARVGHDTVLDAGQTVVWHRPPWNEADVPAHFTVIHEDDSILAVNKPSGLPTMPAGGFLAQTLLTLVRARHGDASPLHRLGRHTSGVVLFARHAAAASALARAWRHRAVKKTYRALSLGSTRTDMIVIDAPIGPVRHPRLGTVQAARKDGKPSHSVATVFERRHDQTLFSVDITTGRPHQVRIHLAYAGFPLVGDPMYEEGGGLKANAGLPGDGGYQLHAELLQFTHPATGETITLHAPPPLALLTREELGRRPHRSLAAEGAESTDHMAPVATTANGPVR